MSHVAGKWVNEDRVHVSEIDTDRTGIVRVPRGQIAIVNGIVQPEPYVRVCMGDRIAFRSRNPMFGGRRADPR